MSPSYPPASITMLINNERPRYLAAVVLRDMGIASVVWFEDALYEYDVPTMLFDLYLLVPNIDTAAQTLERSGWHMIEQQRGRIGNARLNLDQHPQHRLSPTRPGRTTDHRPESVRPSGIRRSSMPIADTEQPQVVLLAAPRWSFEFGYGCSSKAFFPTLEAFLDSLIDSQLTHTDDVGFQNHLRVQIGYLYGNSPALRARSFADRLIYEHRQYHFDVCSGMSHGTVRFVAHQRAIREALRANKIELRECSAERGDEGLFNQAVQARLLAAMPPPKRSYCTGIAK
nr:hypothetical protein CFP56_70629 [Quercus suber]